jgi:hypothetical protein
MHPACQAAATCPLCLRRKDVQLGSPFGRQSAIGRICQKHAAPHHYLGVRHRFGRDVCGGRRCMASRLVGTACGEASLDRVSPEEQMVVAEGRLGEQRLAFGEPRIAFGVVGADTTAAR